MHQKRQKIYSLKLVDLQVELIEIQCDNRLKRYHESHELFEFYHHCLAKQTYPGIYKHALRMVSLFGSTHLCELSSA